MIVAKKKSRPIWKLWVEKNLQDGAPLKCLDTIITIAPLLGILGTVTGIIDVLMSWQALKAYQIMPCSRWELLRR